MEYHISMNGSDEGKGTREQPFRTISRAAAIAGPGDVITVHAGIYREWVSPAFGGTRDAPIVYQGAGDGETVITGAEPVQDWEQTEENIWMTRVDNAVFTQRNPFRERLAGDWLFPGTLEPHLGEVYLNGKSLYEAVNREQLRSPAPWKEAKYPEDSLLRWFAEAGERETVIYANFGGVDPRRENVEISVRPWCFWPEQEGRDYITVRGFTLRQASPQWAPPTSVQEGLIGPNWSRGWIIENNRICESKCVGISLGKRQDTAAEEQSRRFSKGGTQREQEVIFRAVRDNWQVGQIGGHRVRNNVIHDCEQAGIAGHLGGAFSEISGNRIYDIHHKLLFHGAEVAGIKLHAALDTRITDNVICGCYRGIWLDWQAQGTQIRRNVLFDNLSEDLFVEVCHGPYLVDHNLFASRMNFRDMSEGGCFAHNLFAGKFVQRPELTRWTPYHFPHETSVAGYCCIVGGDHRFYNNIFLGDGDPERGIIPMTFFEHLPLPPRKKPESTGPAMDGVPDDSVCWLHPVGLGAYDPLPDGDEKPDWALTPEEEAARTEQYGPPGVRPLPVWMGGNCFLGNAVPSTHEPDALCRTEKMLTVSVSAEKRELTLVYHQPETLGVCPARKAGTLGCAHQAEAGWENPDGSPVAMEVDLVGKKLSGERVAPGPIQPASASPQIYLFR